MFQKFSRRFHAILILFLCSSSLQVRAQKVTVDYATRDTQILRMDIYQPLNGQSQNPCVVFVFGGAFYTGQRDAKIYQNYFRSLADSGFVVASIDYRLGLKDLKKPPSLFNRKPLVYAIEMAVEDLFTATSYLIDHAAEYHIDTSKIIASGSSAGAITALTADFQKRNHLKYASLLPRDFQYAGIISFAGAIYSNTGKPAYKTKPAPMLLFHGNKDDVVPFKKISLFGTGMYGSSFIVKKFKTLHDPYWLYVMDGIGHDVSIYPMNDYLDVVHGFLRQMILEKRPLYEDVLIKDDDRVNSDVDFSKVFKKKKAR